MYEIWILFVKKYNVSDGVYFIRVAALMKIAVICTILDGHQFSIHICLLSAILRNGRPPF